MLRRCSLVHAAPPFSLIRGWLETMTMAAIGVLVLAAPAQAQLQAGVAKVDITNREAGPVNDPLYAKALVLKSADTTVVFVTLDVVAIAEIGSIRNEFLGNLRQRIRGLGLAPQSLIVNASHCHGVVCKDVEDRTFRAIQEASRALTPVRVGVGVGEEKRVSENRRLRLKDGRTTDVRHAYSLPPDAEIVGAGPIDPEIGVLRLDREDDGRILAVVYNFACHPIQGAAGGGNTADLSGFASKVIEENTDPGAVAFFLQGCAGDINPAGYKVVDSPRDSEPLGSLLGLSTLQAVRRIETRANPQFKLVQETIELPRANTSARITALENEQMRLLKSLRGTYLNLKAFLPLAVKYGLSEEFPAASAHRYLQEKALGRKHLATLDATNRRHLDAYVRNVLTMERLTRIQTNLNLLRKHQATNLAAKKRSLDAEVSGIRIGDFVLLTFPAELTVQIGLNLKNASPHPNTFVAAYTNGYLYYAPTTKQLQNVGAAQEDSECLLAPEWQGIFEARAKAILERL